MAFQPKDNSGSLFKNQTRESDSHPHARGSCLIDGVEYWVDAWTNEIQSGENAGQKYQALKFKRKESKREVAGQTKAKVQSRHNEDDDLPPF